MNEKNSNEKGKSCCAAEDAATTCCQPSAGSGSSCYTSGEASGKKTKVLVSVIIIVAAIAVGAHSFVKATSAQSQNAGPGKSFSAGLTQIPPMTAENSSQGEPQTKPPEVPLNQALDNLLALDTLAADKDVVFLVLPGDAEIPAIVIPKPVRAVANNLWNSGQKIAVFTLRNGTPDHNRLVGHFSVTAFPCVIILGRQGSASAVSGEITEAGLYNAFVVASKPASCCPAQGNSSCCPPQSNASCCPK